MTDEVAAAARAVVLVALLLADEVEPDEDERVALHVLDEGPAAHRERLPLDVRLAGRRLDGVALRYWF